MFCLRSRAVMAASGMCCRDGYTAGELYNQLQPHEFDQRGGMARVGIEGSQQERAVNSELFGRRASMLLLERLSTAAERVPSTQQGAVCASW